MTVDCPHCRWKTKLAAPEAPPPVEPAKETRSKAGWVTAVAAFLLLTGGGAFFYWHRQKGQTLRPSQAQLASATKSPAALKSLDVGSTTFSTNDLAVGSITLERATNSTLIYAVGRIKNESERQRFGVRVELDLFNEAGEKIGTASDYLAILEPKREWPFKALVLEKKAVSASFASIKEDQ